MHTPPSCIACTSSACVEAGWLQLPCTQGCRQQVLHPLLIDAASGFNPVDLDPYPAAKAPPGLVGADRYFGDSLYVGWGFLVLLFFTLIEMFGVSSTA